VWLEDLGDELPSAACAGSFEDRLEVERRLARREIRAAPLDVQQTPVCAVDHERGAELVLEPVRTKDRLAPRRDTGVRWRPFVDSLRDTVAWIASRSAEHG
jgi:hypothetical protein